jgi:hypothetical protein
MVLLLRAKYDNKNNGASTRTSVILSTILMNRSSLERTTSKEFKVSFWDDTAVVTLSTRCSVDSAIPEVIVFVATRASAMADAVAAFAFGIDR